MPRGTGCSKHSNFSKAAKGEGSEEPQEELERSGLQTRSWWEGRSQNNQTPPLSPDGRRARGYRMHLWKYAEEGTGNTQRGRRAVKKQRERRPCQLFGWRLPLPRHHTHCLQPSPFLQLSWASLSTDRAGSKAEGDWCGPVLWAVHTRTKSTSLFVLV